MSGCDVDHLVTASCSGCSCVLRRRFSQGRDRLAFAVIPQPLVAAAAVLMLSELLLLSLGTPAAY
jgi:hypothetical protein